MAIADTYRVLSKALILNKFFKDDLYYEYVLKALKIAKDYYSPDSPKLIPYQISLSTFKDFFSKIFFNFILNSQLKVSALQWKSINAEAVEIKKVNINEAYNRAVQVLKISVDIFGEKNLATAKIYRLIGSILYYMERY